MSCELGFRGFLSWLSAMAAILTALHSSDVIGTGLAVFAAIVGVMMIFVLTCAEPEWSQEHPYWRGIALPQLLKIAFIIVCLLLGLHLTETAKRKRAASQFVEEGNTALLDGDFDLAVRKSTRAIEEWPRHAEAHRLRGAAWYRKGRNEKAIQDLTRAIEFDSEDSDAYRLRGAARYERELFREAIPDLDKAIALDPGNADAYGIRGDIRRRLEMYDDAIADFSKAIEIDPAKSELYRARGAVWGAKCQHKRELDDLLAYLKFDPNHAHTHNEVAWLCATCPDRRVRDGVQAVNHANRACELTDWKDPIYLDTLAASYAEQGDFEEAKNWQRRAMELAPEDQKELYRERLDLYLAGKPCRQECRPPISSA